MAPVILVTGCKGQVGNALMTALAPLGQVVGRDRETCDLSDPASLTAIVADVRPDMIVNAAAYTAVDKAQSEQDKAFAVNGAGPGHLAALAHGAGIPLIHYSTDYVFDGSGTAPWREEDKTGPLCVYGASKLAGEAAIRAAAPAHVIFRTSWVFAAHGSNFLKTMLKLASQRDSLQVVADQIGAPTSADLIAHVTAQVARRILGQGDFSFGTYHLAASGQTSWHGYAAFAIAQARERGFPVQVRDEAIAPIAASTWPTPAARPANSRLDTRKLQALLGAHLPSWQDGVTDVLNQLAQAQKA